MTVAPGGDAYLPAEAVARIIREHQAETGESIEEVARRCGLPPRAIRRTLGESRLTTARIADVVTTRLDRQDAWHTGPLADYSADPPPPGSEEARRLRRGGELATA